ncbi:MAG: gephyrin-like molybdotransferase Glp [Gaiellaceae bacterium]
MPPLLTLDDALARILQRVRPLPAEPVPLGLAAGRVLAEAAVAGTDLPPFPSSAMDGFALRAADTPGTLRVAERVAAGRPAGRGLEPGEAFAIATGGVVPDGADAVLPLEYVVEHDNRIDVRERVEPGANVRARGADVRAGETVVPGGSRLGAAKLGALAAAGTGEVSCGRRPRAAVIVTGTELRRAGEPLGPGEIYESNGLILTTQLAAAGAEVEEPRVVVDDEQAHLAAMRAGVGADLLVTSGGVSVGPHDLVRRAGAEVGVEEVFWGVAVQPGKPVSFGVHGDTLVFGLPGNPVSSLVAFELFVRPAVLALQGAAAPGPAFGIGRLRSPVSRSVERTKLVRARSRTTEDGVELEPVGGQESHMIVRAAEADALAVVEAGRGTLEAGATVRYLTLP